MEDLGVARGYIDLDLGKMNQSIATAVSQLQKIDQASKKTDSEIAVLQSTSTKTGNAFEEASKQANTLAVKLENAKSKVQVYEKEIGVLKTQIEEGKNAQVALAKTIEETKSKYEQAKNAVAELEKKYRESKESLNAIKETHKQNNEALQTAKKAMTDYNSQMKAVNKTAKDYATEIKKLEKEQAGVVKEQEKTNKQIQAAKDKYAQAKKSVEDLEKALDEAKDTMHETASEYGYSSDEAKKAREAVEKYEKELDDAKKSLQNYGDELEALEKTQEESNKAYTDLGKSIDTAKKKYKEAQESADKLADSQKATTDELEKAQSAYDKSAKAVADAKDETKAYKAELDDAKGIARDYGNEVNNLETKQRQLDAEIDNAGDKLEEFQTDCNNAKTDVNKLSIELANVKSSAQQFGQYLEDAGNKLKTVSGKMESFGRNLTTHITTPLTAAATASVKMANTYETSLAKVETIADTSVKSMKKIDDEITNISNNTGIASSEIADAYYQVISATANTEDAGAVVLGSAKLKIGGFVDSVEESADLLTTIINTYDMALTDVDEISDKLLAAQNYGKTTVGDMASSLGALVPTAHEAGISLDELMTDLAILTRNGLSTDMAVTALRGSLTSIIKPTDDALEAAAALGIEWNSQALQSKGYAGMMAELQQALNNVEPKCMELADTLESVNSKMDANNETIENNKREIERLEAENESLTTQQRELSLSLGTSSEAYKRLSWQITDNKTASKKLSDENTALTKQNNELKKSADGLGEQLDMLSSAAESPISVFAELFGNVRGLTGALSLGNNLEEYAEGWDIVTNSAGLANKAFDTMQKTTSSKLQRSINRLKNTAIDAGEKIAPVVADIVDKVADIITKFSELDESEQKQILTIGAVVAAAGPAISIAGKVTSAVGGVVGGIGSFIKTVSGVTTVAQTAGGAVEGLAGAAGTAGTALGTKGLSGVLGALATPGVGYAVLAAAALTAVGVACKYAYDQAIENNLAEHFGTVQLSAEEAMRVAKEMTETPWRMSMEAYLTASDDLKEIEGNMEETMKEINKKRWMINTGLQLTDEEKQEYQTSVQTYIDELNEYFKENKYTTQIAVEAIFGENSESETAENISGIPDNFESRVRPLIDKLQEYTSQLTMEGLTEETKDEIRKWIGETIDEINDELAIRQKAQADAKSYRLQMKYSGVDITADSFKEIIKDVDEINKESQKVIDQQTDTLLENIYIDYEASPKSEEDLEKLNKQLFDTEKESLDRGSEILAKGLGNTLDILTEHYTGASKDKASEYIDKYNQWFDHELLSMASGGRRKTTTLLGGKSGFQLMFDAMRRDIQEGIATLTPEEQDAVAKLLKQLEPTEQQLIEQAEKYRKLGLSVPESITEGLNDINALKAMTGDVDAGYKMIAHQLATSPERAKAMAEAIDAGYSLTDMFGNNLQFIEILKQSEPEFYNALMGLDVKGAQGIRDGSYFLNDAAEDVVEDVEDIVNNGDVDIEIGVKQADDTQSKAQRIWDAIKKAFANLKLLIPVGVQTAFSNISHYADGGIVTRAQVATVAEGNDPEAIIPLSTAKRSTALELYEQVGQMLGAEDAIYKNKYSGSGTDLADRIANKLEAVFRNAPVQTNIDMALEDGDVIMDAETVGRKVAPTVSRVQAKRI